MDGWADLKFTTIKKAILIKVIRTRLDPSQSPVLPVAIKQYLICDQKII